MSTRFLFAMAACLTILMPGPALPAADSPAPAAESAQLISRAGNTEVERQRFELLSQLKARNDLDPVLRADLEKLLPVIDLWANGKQNVVADPSRAAENGYLCRFIDKKIQPAGKGAVHPPPMSEGSPLRPIWAMYRGRMLIWRVIQSGPLVRVKESRDAYYNEARKLLEEAQKAFPENRVIRMYLGQPIPWPKERAYDALPEAPEWANLQRQGLEELADVIHWWIDNRQLADGQFGGGWGDDVEMWRWWTPILIAFEDPRVAAAQEKLSSGIFKQPHLKSGFTSRMTDVEHSNEDTTDTIQPMMFLAPDDPVWKGRATRLAELMRDRWTGRNERGQLQFKSIYFSVEKVDDTPGRAFDTVYHPSIVQPTLLYWQRTGDAELTKLFGEWLKVWIDATARAQNGKPAGVLPSTIHWPDGKVGTDGKPWWEPFDPGHNDALYNWPGASRLMTNTLLLTYHMTRDEQYLAPIRSMAAIRMRHDESKAKAVPGTEIWCALKIRDFLPDTLAKYRFLTGDKQYDALLSADASGYVKYRLSGELKPLVWSLTKNARAFGSNWEAYTSEMRWTDRVISFTKNFLQYLPEPAPMAPSPEILYTSASGDPGSPLVFPLNAVRWLTPPREIAALVTDSGRDRFVAELFHFGAQPRMMGAEFYLLKPGRYTVALQDEPGGKPRTIEELVVTGPRAAIRLSLPPRRLCTLRITPVGP